MRGSIAAVFVVAACGGDGPTSLDATADGFDRRALLRNLGEQVVVPTYTAFVAASGELAVAVDGWCAALASADEAARRGDAQTAWRAAMTAWQQAEPMRFGPAMPATPHDYIYSWPTTSSCAVDQDVMTRWNDPAGYDLTGRLSNRRGLPALEYVLFAPTLEVTCAPQAAPAGWDALSDADRRAARCGFAAVAAADTTAQANLLLAAWLPEGGDYLGTLAAAGAAGGPFASAHEAVNAVSDAMFYLDADVKDMKLAEPAGINTNSCGTIAEPCLDELESPWADHGKDSLVANLRGFQMMFSGDGPAAGGPGFDDFLIALNAGDLAATMTADLADAIVAVEAIPGTLGDAVVSARPAVVDAHAAVKRVTDSLKSQFLTVLALELPEDLGDDTD